MGKGRVAEIISEMLYKPGERPEDYEIIFISRDERGNTEVVRGDEIRALHDRIIVRGREIPHHRIVEIRRRGIVLWKK
ncbi:MAG: RNA repair domain-containing protein [Candidatus Methanodesulfokora sp.]|nr:MAG: hypothetical protein C0200_04410 [Candidatus Korarchaeota archaeon]